MNRWKIKHSEYINNVIKIEKENNLLKPYKEYNKIFENFNKNQIVIDHRYDIINIDLEKKYNKVYNKFINDIKNR